MRRLSRRFIGVAALMMLMGLLVSGASVGAATTDANHDWVAVLQSGNEVPTSDEGAAGFAYFHLNGDGQSMDYWVYFWNITDPTMGHIHLGVRGVNGPVVVPLYDAKNTPIKGNYSGIITSGTFTASTFTGPLQGKTMDDLVAAIKSGGAYVNFHDTKLPGGTTRGQVVNADPASNSYGVIG